MDFFATTSPGVEGALHDELKAFGLKGVRPQSGGVPFMGEWLDAWRVCLHSRIALRVMALRARFTVASRDDLYRGVRDIDWTPYISPSHTLSVAAVCQGSVFTHSGMAALVVKDAIVDQVRDSLGERPSVERQNPDVRVFVHLGGERASVYLDMAGEPLSRRGYRTEGGEAPLRETLAAAVLRLAGWDCRTPLLDPMCGSGTLPIEAALWAGRVAPGILRMQFGFERWASFGDEQREALRTLCGEARRQARPSPVSIVAADIDPSMIELARANARRAGVRLTFKTRAIDDWQHDGSRRFVVANPPYDTRLEADSDFCRMVMASLSRMHGCRVAVITALPEYKRVMSLHPVAEIPLKNGPLDCRLLVYEVP